MTANEVSAKFMASATMTVERDQAERFRDAVLHLQTLAVADLAALLRRDAQDQRRPHHSHFGGGFHDRV